MLGTIDAGGCFAPRAIVVTTRLLRVSITETVLESKLATYAVLPSGAIAIAAGFSPTLIGRPITWRALVSMTETASGYSLAT
jgi:uncharacterized membrane protein